MNNLTRSTAALSVLMATGCVHVEQPTQLAPYSSMPMTDVSPVDHPRKSSIETVAYFGQKDDRSTSEPSVDRLQNEDGFDAQYDRKDDSDDAKDEENRGNDLEPFLVPAARSHKLPTESSSNDMPIVGETAGYTLADIEAMALGNNPSIDAAQATTSKAAGLRQQVGTRPNPSLGYFGQQIADRNTDQHGIFIEQEFVRGNKLQLNRDVLGHTQRAQAAESQTQRFRVLTDVRVRFFEAIAAQQQVDATHSFAEVARRGVQVAEERQEAEEGTLVETLQARTLLSEVTLAAEQAEVAYRGAWCDLAAIAGLRVDTPSRLIAELKVPLESPDWQVAYSEILSQSPELVAAEAIVCEKQALLRRQQAQPIPNVTAQLGAGYDNGTDHGMMNVLLSAPIPVWNKNSGNISAAYSDYVRATQEVQRIKQSIRSRLARASQDYDSAMRSVRKFEDEIVPQAKQSLELSEEAYRAGELEFLQVLIVRRSYYESSIRLIMAKGDLAQAAARVDGLLLTGGLDSPVDYTDGDGVRGASFGGQ